MTVSNDVDPDWQSLGVLAFAAALVLSALRDSIVFFNSPTDLAESELRQVRVCALVAGETRQY